MKEKPILFYLSVSGFIILSLFMLVLGCLLSITPEKNTTQIETTPKENTIIGKTVQDIRHETFSITITFTDKSTLNLNGYGHPIYSHIGEYHPWTPPTTQP